MIATIALCLLALFAGIYLALRFWAFWLGLAVVVCLMASCGSQAATAELAVVVDSASIDRATVERAIVEASTVLAPAGITLRVVSYETANPANHTHAETLLDSFKAYRMGKPGDVAVLFTERKLTRGFVGIATMGPACSASAAAIVSLRYDGTDATTLAHEIAHTFGVEHDAASGWLMSTGNGISQTMSPDTLGVIKGSYLDCMADAKPASVPTGTQATGGGGAMGHWFLAAILLIGWARTYDQLRRCRAECDRRGLIIDRLAVTINHIVDTEGKQNGH